MNVITMPSINIGITLDRATLEQLEKARGDVSRSRFIQRAIEYTLKKEGSNRI